MSDDIFDYLYTDGFLWSLSTEWAYGQPAAIAFHTVRKRLTDGNDLIIEWVGE